MTPQLDTVIFQVPSVKELSLGGNTEAILGQTFAINEMVTQDCTLAKLAILT